LGFEGEGVFTCGLYQNTPRHCIYQIAQEGESNHINKVTAAVIILARSSTVLKVKKTDNELITKYKARSCNHFAVEKKAMSLTL